MGCDIHVRLEKKTENGWIPLELYYKDDGELKVKEVYGDRDYRTFTALCGVRDYSEESEKISEPKGVPNDAHSETKEYILDVWGSDGHSHSWNTLAELYEFQENNKTMKFTGLISPEQARDFDEKGVKPGFWCQGTSRKDWVRRDWEDEFDALGGLIKAVEGQIKSIDWCWNPRDHADKYRIVYCFDN